MDYQTTWNRAAELQDVLPIFDLSESQRTWLVERMKIRELRRGAVLYERGDPGDEIFVIHTGTVKVFTRDAEGPDVIVCLAGRGEFLGTLTLFSEPRRENSVSALIPTVLLAIRRADALEVLEQNPKAMGYITRTLAETVRRREEQITTRALQPLSRRVAGLLFELERLRVDLTQGEIASAVDSSRERVNRTLADLAKRGLVARDSRRLRILDRDRLCELLVTEPALPDAPLWMRGTPQPEET